MANKHILQKKGGISTQGKTVKLNEYLAERQRYYLIDVRTKAEFQNGSIPSSTNIPLFNEHERQEIGRVYCNDQRKARLLAMDIAVPKIPGFVRSVAEYHEGKPVLVLCWRGGLRSLAAASFLTLAGLVAYQLRGGYQNYRRALYHQLQEYSLEERLVLLTGKSGVGKTEILSLLAEQGFPVLDLEALAGHRGSFFGGVGNGARCQKNFDALLYDELTSLRGRSPIFVESESRRIGNICLPAFLFTAMKSAPSIQIVSSMERRVARILKQYTPTTGAARTDLYLALYHLKERLGLKAVEKHRRYLDTSRYGDFTRSILANYYDKCYALAKENSIAKVSSDDIGVGAEAIIRVATEYFGLDKVCQMAAPQ